MLNQYAQWELCSGIAQTEQCNGREITGYIEQFLKTRDLLQDNYFDFRDTRERTCTIVRQHSMGSFQRARSTTSLTGVNTDQRERAAILIRLASLIEDDDLAHRYRAEAFGLDRKNVDSRYQMLKSLYSRKNYIGVRIFVTSATDLKDTKRQMAHLGCMIDMISSK